MNGLQHLTTLTSLKFCLALCFSSGPNSSKFGPSCPQVGPNFFHLAKEMATTFLHPERTLRSIIELNRDLMVKHILTKFDANWSIFVDEGV